MRQLRMAHTYQLDAGALAQARALLDDVFHGEVDEHDWEHCLGGVHVLVWEGPELIGHACVIQRRLSHAGRALRTGYVEGVGVRADRRGRGHGAAMMSALERVIRGAYDVGALAATDEALDFYAGCGWKLWQGPTSAMTPSGVQRTPDADGCVFVLPVEIELDLRAELTCDWRSGDLW